MVTLGFEENEVFSDLKVPGEMFVFIRCNGRRFHKLVSRARFKKPFDAKFMDLMVKASSTVFFSGFNPLLAYLFSDEVNYLFKDLPFNGRLEKIDSIIPSTLSSSLSIQLMKNLGLEAIVSFDSRVIILDRGKVIDYLVWRQNECWRNHNNAYAFQILLEKGFTSKQASMKLKGMKTQQLHDLTLKINGLNLSKTPAWQRRGVLIYLEKYLKEGFNPLEHKKVKTERRKLKVMWNPPLFSTNQGRSFLSKIIFEAVKGEPQDHPY